MRMFFFEMNHLMLIKLVQIIKYFITLITGAPSVLLPKIFIVIAFIHTRDFFFIYKIPFFLKF